MSHVDTLTFLRAVWLLAVFCAGQSQAQDVSPRSEAEPAIGRIVATTGVVDLYRADGSQEIAQRRERLYEGDALQTGFDGFVQMRMIDSAQISLACNSRLEIRRYPGEELQGNVELILHQGGMRTISGSFGQDRYRLRTAVTDLQIEARGATFQVVMEASNSFLFAVYDGSIRLINSQSVIVLDSQSAGSHVRLTSGSPPELIDQAVLRAQAEQNCPQLFTVSD